MSQVNGYTDCVNRQSVMGLPPPEEMFAGDQCIQDDVNCKAIVEATAADHYQLLDYHQPTTRSFASLVELVKEERGMPVHGEYIYRDSSALLFHSILVHMKRSPISREEYIDLRERFRNQQ